MKNIFTITAQQLGRGPVRFDWQKRVSTYLAVVGVNNTANIYDRHGQFVDSVPLTSECTGLEWAPDGGILAIIQAKSTKVLFWDADNRRSTESLDTNMKNLQFLKWSPKGDLLAVGTSRGNLLIYDRKERKEVPIMGKHSKAIVTGCWSWDNILACGSDDRTFTLSNADGDTVFSMGLTGEPSQMQWANMKNAHGSQDPVLSTIIADKTLFIHNVNHPDSPVELAFQPKYGSVVSYQWFAEGYVLVGFSTGYLIVISTNDNDMGQEIFSTRNHKGSLSHVAISSVLGKAASCGDNTIKVHELSDLRDVYAVETVEDESAVDRLQWSDDGQFLTVSTKEGSIYTYLARMPMIGGVWSTLVAHLTGLREITIHDQAKTQRSQVQRMLKKELEIEPSVVALGGSYLGVVSQNRAGFYNVKKALGNSAREGDALETESDEPPVMIKEYQGPLKSFSMNPFYAAALLSDGRLEVHAIADDTSDQVKGDEQRLDYHSLTRKCKPPSVEVLEKIFPERMEEKKAGGAATITCTALTQECVIYGTSIGDLKYYLLDEWALVGELKHKKGIQSVYPQPRGGTKVIFIDAVNDGYLTDPATNSVMAIPRWSAKTQGVLWESDSPPSRSIFISWDDAYITTYAYQPFTIKGPVCIALGATKLPFGLKPVLMLSGEVTCQTVAGRISTVQLATHEIVPADQFMKDKQSEQDQGKGLQLYYTLGMLKEIWPLIGTVKARKPWIMLAEAALRVLDLKTAKRIYRQALADAGMVFSLQRLDNVEEKNLLAGHVSAIFGDVSAAQEYFVQSTYPKAALELRRDLMQWEQALTLANGLAPEEVTIIAKEYAQQLELNGKYSEAFAMYERALSTSEQHPGLDAARDEHQITCSAGLTRMTLRLGDVSRGMKMLAEATDRQLLRDCGAILDVLKQYAEAAKCYERGGYWEKAAEIWIKAKSWNRLAAILDKITAPKIFAQYAKAKEAEKDYTEAARAYEKAKDYDNVVRIFIDHLQNIEGAVSIVRKTRSRESAKLVSKFFQSIKDYKSVVEFFLMAGMREEAFELAQQHDVMEHFAELVKDEATPEILINIASYLENKRQYLLAGKYLLQAGDCPRALRMFLQCPPTDEESIDMAIETVGLAKSDVLTHQLIDYLMGETDGMPKDAKYIFKLYMSLGQYREAARTAIIIAREEQALGNYRTAHDLLFDNYKQLRGTKNHVPAEIERMLMLLHSYILVKTLVRISEHEQAARMLIRVSNNISKFPAHMVQILTSTVIECHRAGLKRGAFEYAAMLMRPEYRNKVDAKYKRRIEQIVRRPEKDEIEESSSPCPYCGNNVPDTVLDCLECKNHIPYCIVTGRHMILSDWTTCPSCNFSALHSHFTNLLSKSPSCPMCSASIQPNQLVLLPVAEAKISLQGKKPTTDEDIQDEKVEKSTEREAGSGEEAALQQEQNPSAVRVGQEQSRTFLRRSRDSVRVVKGGSSGQLAAGTNDGVKATAGIVV
ncbi:uncharacterized protein SPPG_04298 [Spizellomyces punctatus DAOM BR117]|uniref:Uncharacterized protein n=1 Tax=Spizellomyces punctatus (strain DAOM BR117) TaxID=645134 RepID=A0A0L0HJK5_SPIPD|nr:uncharacterized protein SPPG_04298 [Spizellomyces punctatus DAOM BR117]KND01208.1 hypothetical protein SPPG_04298 [Spizellomyces punctatus DAOM BR117]|eukprot:XP_016609247.1 hypothetical protein SPPG_04298 [Spizellomyces punctatus DAOM BR117]